MNQEGPKRAKTEGEQWLRAAKKAGNAEQQQNKRERIRALTRAAAVAGALVVAADEKIGSPYDTIPPVSSIFTGNASGSSAPDAHIEAPATEEAAPEDAAARRDSEGDTDDTDIIAPSAEVPASEPVARSEERWQWRWPWEWNQPVEPVPAAPVAESESEASEPVPETPEAEETQEATDDGVSPNEVGVFRWGDKLVIDGGEALDDTNGYGPRAIAQGNFFAAHPFETHPNAVVYLRLMVRDAGSSGEKLRGYHYTEDGQIEMLPVTNELAPPRSEYGHTPVNIEGGVTFNKRGLMIIEGEAHIYEDEKERHVLFGGSQRAQDALERAYLDANPDASLLRLDAEGKHLIVVTDIDNVAEPIDVARERSGFFGRGSSLEDAQGIEETFVRVIR